jgi:hypothetical protein
MKKLVAIFAAALLLAGCAENKTFNTGNGKTVTAEPYGWMNPEDKVDNVEYQLCVSNVVLDVVFFETIVLPVILTGTQLWEPVSYIQPDTAETYEPR